MFVSDGNGIALGVSLGVGIGAALGLVVGAAWDSGRRSTHHPE
jgi:hypothetical protein